MRDPYIFKKVNSRYNIITTNYYNEMLFAFIYTTSIYDLIVEKLLCIYLENNMEETVYPLFLSSLNDTSAVNTVSVTSPRVKVFLRLFDRALLFG